MNKSSLVKKRELAVTNIQNSSQRNDEKFVTKSGTMRKSRNL